MEELHAGNRRRHLRFVPDVKTIEDLQKRSNEALAHIDLNNEGDSFAPTLLGLVGDLSHNGCSIAMLNLDKETEALTADREVKIKAGALHPMHGVIRWRKELESDDLLRIGIEFLE